MSKKTNKAERDAKTQQKIEALAGEIAKRALSGREPAVEIPTRTKSNTIWNKKKGILEMGDGTAERPLFDLKTAKQFMQTMLHASTIQDLIAAGKTSSLRGVFYKAKHTVAGTKENTFDTQDESDPILEDLEVLLAALREELHIFAENRGAMVGNTMRCRRSLSPTSSSSRSPRRSSSCTSRRARSGIGSMRTASGRSTTAS